MRENLQLWLEVQTKQRTAPNFFCTGGQGW